MNRQIEFQIDDQVVIESMRQLGVWVAFKEHEATHPDSCFLVRVFNRLDKTHYFFAVFKGVVGDEGFALVKIPDEVYETDQAQHAISRLTTWESVGSPRVIISNPPTN